MTVTETLIITRRMLRGPWNKNIYHSGLAIWQSYMASILWNSGVFPVTDRLRGNLTI